MCGGTEYVGSRSRYETDPEAAPLAEDGQYLWTGWTVISDTDCSQQIKLLT